MMNHSNLESSSQHTTWKEWWFVCKMGSPFFSPLKLHFEAIPNVPFRLQTHPPKSEPTRVKSQRENSYVLGSMLRRLNVWFIAGERWRAARESAWGWSRWVTVPILFGSDNFDPSKPGMSSLLKPSPGVGTDVPIAKLNIVYGCIWLCSISILYSRTILGRISPSPKTASTLDPKLCLKKWERRPKSRKTHPNVHVQIYGGFRKLGYPKMNGL